MSQVGHSHGYIDQIFSCISRFLQRVHAFCIMSLHTAITKAWSKHTGNEKKRAQCFEIEEVFSVSEWIDSMVSPFDGIRNPQVMKLVLGEDEIEVNGVKVKEKVVWLHARHTAMSRSFNQDKARVDDIAKDQSKYEEPRILMR